MACACSSEAAAYKQRMLSTYAALCCTMLRIVLRIVCFLQLAMVRRARCVSWFCSSLAAVQAAGGPTGCEPVTVMYPCSTMQRGLLHAKHLWCMHAMQCSAVYERPVPVLSAHDARHDHARAWLITHMLSTQASKSAKSVRLASHAAFTINAKLVGSTLDADISISEKGSHRASAATAKLTKSMLM